MTSRRLVGREEVRGPVIRRVMDLNLVDFPHLRYRSGVIPYYYDEETKDIYFCLGEDRKSGEMTDFGGGVSSRDRTPIKTAVRELKEETQGLLSLKVSNVKPDICLYNAESMIIFHKVDYPFFINSKEMFESTNSTNEEIKSIKWVKGSVLTGNNGEISVYEKTKSIVEPRYYLLESTLKGKL